MFEWRIRCSCCRICSVVSSSGFVAGANWLFVTSVSLDAYFSPGASLAVRGYRGQTIPGLRRGCPNLRSPRSEGRLAIRNNPVKPLTRWGTVQSKGFVLTNASTPHDRTIGLSNKWIEGLELVFRDWQLVGAMQKTSSSAAILPRPDRLNSA